MRFSYKLSNILGSVHTCGTLRFFADGNRLVSPVGNKLVVIDLKNSKSESLAIEAEYNLSRLSISPNASLLLASTEKTHLYMISLISETILHRKEFKHIGDKITDLQFSPDGKYYVVCGTNTALVYLTPGFALSGKGRQLSPFKIHKIIKASYDQICCVAWSVNSKLLIISSKDFVIRVHPIDNNMANVSHSLNLIGHSDFIVNSFFANVSPNQLNIYSLSRNKQMFVWQSNYASFDELLQPNEQNMLLNYKKVKSYYFNEDLKNSYESTHLTDAAYNEKMKLLVTGFNNGSFILYEMPEITLIQSLQLSQNSPISSIQFNTSGDWIAIGSSISSGNKFDLTDSTRSNCQLIVWEWQSESFILKQSGYANGLTNVCQCIAYSPDATLLASGASDGKIHIWNTLSGFCVSTFSEEHSGPVTDIQFVPTKDGKVIISSSLDGTVKAFDLNRYRNFRTFSAPSDSKPAQFICLAIDPLSGDFIAAGAHNFFEIFLWSLKTGKLLECLAGHEAPVSGLNFSPVSNTLVSCSWDSTIRIWDLFESSKCVREVVKLGNVALALCFKPDGQQFAVSTLNGNISFFDVHTGEQLGIPIEGMHDLGASSYESDPTIDKNKFFSTIHYSLDGSYIIAAGKSKHICIYHINEKILVKKFTICRNLSMDGMLDYISKRKITEFGFKLSMIKYREENTQFAPISLPGSAKSDFSSRSVNPAIDVYNIKFSPTMRTFSLASTEGILIYSLDKICTFDPYQLDTSITPMSLKVSLQNKQYCDSLMQAIKLNDQILIEQVLESVPLSEISLIAETLPLLYIEKCLRSIAVALNTTKHIEFYLKWCQILLFKSGNLLKTNVSFQTIMPTLRFLHQNLSLNFQNINNVCEHNKYLLRFIKIISHQRSRFEQLIDENTDEQIDGNDLQSD